VKGIKLVLLFLLPFSLLAQPDSTLVKASKEARTLKKLGRNSLKQGDPVSAAMFLKAYEKKRPKDHGALMLLGTAQLEMRDYEGARQTFGRAYSADHRKNTTALYYYALMQKVAGSYDSARAAFVTFRKEYKGAEKALKRRAAKEISFCDSIRSIMGIKNKVVVSRLNNAINKVNAESAPVMLDDRTLLYSSLRTDRTEFTSAEDSTGPKRKLYLARRSGSDWIFAGEFGALNDPSYNVGNAVLNEAGNRMYFTKCRRNVHGKMICQIYASNLTGDTWSEPEKLLSPVNSNRYTSTMPATGIDPVKGYEILYLVSDRKKGRGGLDIWYTTYDRKKQKYKPLRNAGSRINSAGDEITPYFDHVNRTLYYSSDAMGGLGGFDIFRATGDGRRWIAVENLGKPYNSGADDIYYFPGKDKREGFFVSNRPGGNALSHATCCDDIYRFRNPEDVKVIVRGTVFDALEDSRTIPQASIDLVLEDPRTHEKIVVSTTMSDSKGTFTFEAEADKEYKLRVRKTDYLSNIESFNTMNLVDPKRVMKNVKIMKQPKDPIVIPNVLYDFDKSDLSVVSKQSIDSMLIGLLTANPELIIEIQSHTDSKGTLVYNRRLSQRRASEIVRYLEIKGIASARLKAKGYGEEMPVAPNENPDGSDNPQGRAKNRRTQFKIIGNLDAEIIEKE
jgi:OmpA-OmpF porin, OOP family